jgi:hypothetical protein
MPIHAGEVKQLENHVAQFRVTPIQLEHVSAIAYESVDILCFFHSNRIFLILNLK